ncbi:MAG: class I SAM-dependent methyltransferase [Chthoniobacteraceae bacterium]
MSANNPDELQRIYGTRFAQNREYRNRVWQVLTSEFFSRFIRPADTVLDLGCGYGEFINHMACGQKYAMDLNPDAPKLLAPGITFLEQDCSTRWPLDDNSLNAVFTSNFFEHLPGKEALSRTLDEVKRCLVPGGCLIAMGPNIRYLAGSYWDFWDHHLALTDLSLEEALVTRGMVTDTRIDRFLPYTMAQGSNPPIAFLRAYLRLPIAWPLFGRQFLVVSRKPQ